MLECMHTGKLNMGMLDSVLEEKTEGYVLRSVTTGIKNFLSCVKTNISSLLSSHSSCSLSQEPKLQRHNLRYEAKLHKGSSSGCMTLNCPPHCSVLPEHSSHAHGPRDCLRTDDTTYCASPGMPDLDPSSSTDSTQTHDSLATPESPPYLSSPAESLEEGMEEAPVTQVRINDSLTYDSLVTALSRLSLEPPAPDPYQDHQ